MYACRERRPVLASGPVAIAWLSRRRAPNEEGTMMGKTADNERIRLSATFYNNPSVGCLVAGALVPYVALGRVLAELNRTGQIPYAENRNFCTVIFFVALSVLASWWMRRMKTASFSKS